MTFAESLATYLQNHAGLIALVNSRIHPVRAPDSVLADADSYVTFSLRIEPENQLNECGIDLATITAIAYARPSATRSGYGRAHEIAQELRNALAFFRGQLALNGYVSQGSQVISSEDSDSADAGVSEVTTTAEMFYCP